MIASCCWYIRGWRSQAKQKKNIPKKKRKINKINKIPSPKKPEEPTKISGVLLWSYLNWLCRETLLDKQVILFSYIRRRKLPHFIWQLSNDLSALSLCLSLSLSDFSVSLSNQWIEWYMKCDLFSPEQKHPFGGVWERPARPYSSVSDSE